MEKKKSNFPKFMLLWSGELVSAIGGGLTSFGLGVYVFRQTGSAAGMSVGRGAALVIMAAGVLLGVTAMLLYLVKSVRALEKGGVYAKKADRE